MAKRINPVDGMLNELFGKRKTKRVRSRGYSCGECSAKLTREQYRESVHCSPCLEEMDRHMMLKYGGAS